MEVVKCNSHLRRLRFSFSFKLCYNKRCLDSCEQNFSDPINTSHKDSMIKGR